MCEDMKREYALARAIITLFFALGTFIVLIRDDIFFAMFCTILITLVAMFGCFLGTPISQKILQIGDKIQNMLLRIIYYLILLVILIVVPFILFGVIFNISSQHEAEDLAHGLSEAIFTLMAGFSFFIIFLIPYIQTIIVLVLRSKEKVKQ